MQSINLTNFFQPLTTVLIFKTILLWLCWDSTGFFIAIRLLKSPKFTRLIWWQLGMGFFIFCWFIVNLFVPLRSNYVFATLIIPTALSLPFYVSHRGFVSLFKAIKRVWVALLISFPILPALFVKASLPPYQFDEMAYHFISPNQLLLSQKWHFDGELFQVIPRNLNILFHAFFAYFSTYSPARLTHFFIIFTAILVIYRWLYKSFSSLGAILIFILFLYLPGQNLLPQATSGYIDIGTASFVITAVILTVTSVYKNKLSYLATASAFWGLAMGSKYTSVLAFASYILVALPILIYKNRKNTSSFVKSLFACSVAFIVFGGFWYVKNLIITHNPIYPFLFGCQPGDCVGNGALFSGWTTPVTLNNAIPIFSSLVDGNLILGLIIVVALLTTFLTRSRKLKQISLVILGATVVEFIFMKFFSGYYARYFIHLHFLVLIFLGLQLYSARHDYAFTKTIKLVLLLCLCLFIYKYVRHEERYMYSSSMLPSQEISYATGKTNIWNWVDYLLPDSADIVHWCSDQKSLVTLNEADPDLIWFKYAGMMRIFMTNCQLSVFDTPQDFAPDTTFKYIQQTIKTDTFFVSLNTCTPSAQIKTLGYEKPDQLRLRYVNNDIVCHTTKLTDHIYKYTPSTQR